MTGHASNAQTAAATGEATTVYVEKRPHFSDTARGRGRELQELLGISGLQSLRYILRYDIGGISRDLAEEAIDGILADPITDAVSVGTLESGGYRTIAVEFLPGQFDQRADSAAEAIEILTGGTRPLVRVSELYLFDETLSDTDIGRATEQIVNAVDSRTCEPFGPPRFHTERNDPPPVPILEDLFTATENTAENVIDELGLAMSPEDLAVCRRYFSEEGRPPTETEIRVLDTYWSDHCRHTTFETHLDDIRITGGGAVAETIGNTHRRFLELRRELFDSDRAAAPPTLMELATIAARAARKQGQLTDLLVSEEVNAATVQIDVEGEAWYLLFKNETHNHPTEIEPIGGAETCLGGAIRDPLSGRAYVYQAMRVTGGANPLQPITATRPGKLPQRTITTQAARGFSSYGNQIGLATGVVQEFFHPGYEAKRLEIGAVIGAAPVAQVDHRVPAPGDIVVLIGGRTGRDGCGGATGSSKAHSTASITEASAEVQKGNPPVERALQRLFRNADFSARVKRANDFGAGGVAVAVGEIAEGLEIDLDAVPVKYDGLNGTELAISESQERMAIVIDPADKERILAAARDENLEATVIAQVTATDRLVMRWRGTTIVDIGRPFLATNGASRRAAVEVTAPDSGTAGPRTASSYAIRDRFLDPTVWVDRLGELDVASRKGLSEIFDSTIGAGTLLAPWGGRYQLTPNHVAAARIPHPERDVKTASMISYGFLPRTSTHSPYHGAYWSVVESVARLVCAGARREQIRLSLQEYFPRTANDPQRWGLPYAALLGALEAQLALATPAIGGKDSMSGSFEDLDVPPTLVSFSFCAAEEERIIGPEFTTSGGYLVLLVPPVDGGGIVRAETLTELLDTVEGLITTGTVCAAGTVTESGVAAALTTAALGNWCSLELDPEALQRAENTAGILQGNGVAAYLQMSEPPEEKLRNAPGYILLGRVADTSESPFHPANRRGPYNTSDGAITVGDARVSLATARDAWFAPLGALFPLEDYGPVPQTATPAARASGRPRSAGIARPQVCIPVFPGTNCEYDSVRAFRDHDARALTPVFRKHSSTELDASVEELAAAISSSQILMFPGGFSAGDEPDGSGKYIAAVFRDPRLTAAMTTLLERNDGLILGICNGFQALVRMGLLPDGLAGLHAPQRLGLFLNTGLHHISTIATTRVLSQKSPWLAATDPSREYRVPISHGEGRIIADEELLVSLRAGGQIATQYVEYNPNGSRSAIEGITSPDGRVFGKMAHNERVRPGLYRNVPPIADMKLFENGVAYFR